MSFIDNFIKIKELTDGKFMLICHSGLALTVVDNCSGYGFELADENDGASQLFTFRNRERNTPDVWEISLAADDRYCLDICGCSDRDGTPLIAYPRNNSPAQRFKAVRDGEGYRLLTAASGYKKYLAVAPDGKTLVQSSNGDEKSLWATC